MRLGGYGTLSPETKEQIRRLVDIWTAQLGDALAGVYLHGSIALGRFMEGSSDIDALIVTQRRIGRDERLSIAEAVIGIDRAPCPLEMSAVWLNDLRPWKHPTPCQFHYSDAWTERYGRMLSGETGEHLILDEDFRDSDIACHVRLISQCGIRLVGKPIHEVFPAVPEADFWQSISADVDGFDFHDYAPGYFPSNILTLGRVLSYKREKRILSKYDAGAWMLGVVPEGLRYIVNGALRAWYAGEPMPECDPDDLLRLRRFLVAEIHK